MSENFERKAKKAEESLAKRFIIPKKPINGYKKYKKLVFKKFWAT